MAYKSLYRKYRPVYFDDVCGQEFIIKTLKNALSNNKVGHAYLFSGTRGTGKTTIAKIFAKSVNCLLPNENGPCGKCEICTSENTDEIPDIIEIDAASNNGVDEIRELKNKIKLVPVTCKYKVYIIDEVHMLSTGAFNALLKTLEEPPSHVIFILATTDPQKLPITVMSRCQRFDFKKISNENIIKRLKYISEKENINIEIDALEEIAKISDGALRDSIGLLEQLSSFSDKIITIDDIYMIKGSISYKQLFELIGLYFRRDINNILMITEKIYEEGKDFKVLTEDMLAIFRDILICKKAPEYFENKNSNIKEDIKSLSKMIDDNKLVKIISNLEEMTRNLKYSNYPKILFEMFLLSDVETCINRIEKTEVKEKKDKIIEKKGNDNEIKKQEYIGHKEELINNNLKTIQSTEENSSLKIVENEYTKETKFEFDNSSLDKKALINNTIALASSKCKKRIQDEFYNLDKYLIDKNYKIAATILKDAAIAAASEDHVLLTYKYASMVEDNDREIMKVKALLKQIFNCEYKVVAITNDEWKETRPFYIEEKKKKGFIPLMEEKNIVTNKKIVDNTTSEVDDMINIFGSELIEMEE